MAKLYFRYGAMNSGKTALLLQAAYNYEQQGMKVLVAKPSKEVKVGATLDLSIVTKPEKATLSTVTWTSSDSTVVVTSALISPRDSRTSSFVFRKFWIQGSRSRRWRAGIRYFTK